MPVCRCATLKIPCLRRGVRYIVADLPPPPAGEQPEEGGTCGHCESVRNAASKLRGSGLVNEGSRPRRFDLATAGVCIARHAQLNAHAPSCRKSAQRTRPTYVHASLHI